MFNLSLRSSNSAICILNLTMSSAVNPREHEAPFKYVQSHLKIEKSYTSHYLVHAWHPLSKLSIHRIWHAVLSNDANTENIHFIE